jgi:hypothetical protein
MRLPMRRWYIFQHLVFDTLERVTMRRWGVQH